MKKGGSFNKYLLAVSLLGSVVLGNAQDTTSGSAKTGIETTDSLQTALDTHRSLEPTTKDISEILSLLDIPAQSISPELFNNLGKEYVNKLRQKHGIDTLTTSKRLLDANIHIAHLGNQGHTPNINRETHKQGIKGQTVELLVHAPADATLKEVIHNFLTSESHRKALSDDSFEEISFVFTQDNYGKGRCQVLLVKKDTNLLDKYKGKE